MSSSGETINPYELFGLTPNSTLKELKSAYYHFARMCHPDKGGSTQMMHIVSLAYGWIRSQLTEVEKQHESFETYYNEHLHSQAIKGFTDILAETLDYTREAFGRLCCKEGIQSPEIIEMLFVPAFEWSQKQNATPENLWDTVESFLKMYVSDTAKGASLEFYVPMSDARGYGTIISQHASNETSYESHREDYETSMVAYKEPMALNTWSDMGAALTTAGASIAERATGIASTFTTFVPKALYDYEEAFQSAFTSASAYASASNEPMELPPAPEASVFMADVKKQIEERNIQNKQFENENKPTTVMLLNSLDNLNTH
jgi:hypothetical protein